MQCDADDADCDGERLSCESRAPNTMTDSKLKMCLILERSALGPIADLRIIEFTDVSPERTFFESDELLEPATRGGDGA
jgi:hypothetical protein